MTREKYIWNLVKCATALIIFCSVFCANASENDDRTISSSYILQRFSPFGAIMNHLAFDKELGYIYVGAQNRLYQLNGSLEQIIANITVGPELDGINCLPSNINLDCDKTLKNNTNKLLLIDKGKKRLIACGSIFQGVCITRSLHNISKVLSGIPANFETSDVIAPDIKDGTTVGIITEGPTVNNSVLYVAITTSSSFETGEEYYYDHEKTIATRSLQYDPTRENKLFKYAIEVEPNSQTQGSTLSGVSGRKRRKYKYVFETGGADGYVYFVMVQTSKFPFLVARICKSDPFYYSYVELPISCQHDDKDILGAYYSPVDNKNKNGTLYVLFGGEESSSVCSFTLSHLDIQFFRVMELCFKYEGRDEDRTEMVKSIDDKLSCVNDNGKAFLKKNVSLYSHTIPQIFEELPYYKNYTPPSTMILCGSSYFPHHLTALWTVSGNLSYKEANTVFTSITTSVVKNITVGFIGTEDGSIIQVNLNEESRYNKIYLDANARILSDLIWTKNELEIPLLYVPTSASILKVRVAACEMFLNCSSCLSSKDPYCGWCILENRCTMEEECKTAKRDMTRWLGFNSKHCLYIDPPQDVDRASEPREISMMVNPLPVLDGSNEKYQCVYNDQLSYDAKYGRINDTAATVTCKRPAGSKLPKTPTGNDFLNVPVSVQFVTTIKENGIELNISVDVVTTTIIYYDCSVYGQNTETLRPCAGCLSSNWACRWCVKESKCVSSNNAESECLRDTAECPTVSSVAPEDQLVSVGVSKQIKLFTENLPADGTPHCLMQLQSGKPLYLSAVVSPNRDYVTCENQVYNYTEFYKCAVDRSDCSRCVTAASKYNCGWCNKQQQCTIEDLCHEAGQWFTDGDSCPALKILGFHPTSGPLVGGTLITIEGVNMGTNVSEVDGVRVGGNCIIQKSLYQTSIRIVCKTTPVKRETTVRVSVTVKGHTESLDILFHYRAPKLLGVSPRKGPKAGGTKLTITGEHLDTGAEQNVRLIGDGADLPCNLSGDVTANELFCHVSASSLIVSNLSILVSFDAFHVNMDQTFSYVANPQIESSKTLGKFTSFFNGGRNISVNGSNFNYIQNPSIRVTLRMPKKRLRRRFARSPPSDSAVNYELPSRLFERVHSKDCQVKNNTFMTCYTPKIEHNFNEADEDCKVGNISNSVHWLANVEFVLDGTIVNGNQPLVYYPSPVFEKWDDPIERIASQQLTINVCKPYNLKEALTKSEVLVKVGDNKCEVQLIDESKIDCTIPEAEDDTSNDLYPVSVTIGKDGEENKIGQLMYHVEGTSLNTGALIAIACGGVFVVVALAAGLFMRKNKLYKAKKSNHQQAIETLEMSVRADFLKAFAELNVDMNDLTADIEDSGIPCLDYRTYVTNLFFPSFKYHPCMKAPDVEITLSPHLEQGLSQFYLLLSNRNFLSSFIHTLEEQKSFSNREKGNVASLLTVVLHSKLDYFTEVMKSLVSDLITVGIQRNPKLILRRSDSVAERMLSNWMYICLYPYLRDKAGSPIFLLLKAIKQQVSKGPVDGVTGRARYTLSDDRLLQEDVENKVLVKEKVMDAVYKRVPFSQRPRADQLDIEWRNGRGGHVVLPSEDYAATDPNSRWRRLMTIADYRVNDNATITLIAQQHECEDSQDLSSAISCHTADTNPLSPMLLDDNIHKTYHLVKYTDDVDGKRESTINRDRHKHIPEIYLLRLISMKGTLQTYVDAALNAILDRSSIPLPVRHFFHFLDDKASRHEIDESEILHIWKTNSLLGRFWVTILKNPDSVFDIEKPDTIASSMAVISQTFIDACSVTEHKPTKDSPINKQLYAKEIPNYKKLVQEYYKVIKEQPPVSEQDINAYIAEIAREHKFEFDVNNALKELWGYLNKYYEEIKENLEVDTNIHPSVMSKLEQTYTLMDTDG